MIPIYRPWVQVDPSPLLTAVCVTLCRYINQYADDPMPPPPQLEKVRLLMDAHAIHVQSVIYSTFVPHAALLAFTVFPTTSNRSRRSSAESSSTSVHSSSSSTRVCIAKHDRWSRDWQRIIASGNFTWKGLDCKAQLVCRLKTGIINRSTPPTLTLAVGIWNDPPTDFTVLAQAGPTNVTSFPGCEPSRENYQDDSSSGNEPEDPRNPVHEEDDDDEDDYGPINDSIYLYCAQQSKHVPSVCLVKCDQLLSAKESVLVQVSTVANVEQLIVEHRPFDGFCDCPSDLSTPAVLDDYIARDFSAALLYNLRGTAVVIESPAKRKALEISSSSSSCPSERIRDKETCPDDKDALVLKGEGVFLVGSRMLRDAVWDGPRPHQVCGVLGQTARQQ